jgi:hypothetical protein
MACRIPCVVRAGATPYNSTTNQTFVQKIGFLGSNVTPLEIGMDDEARRHGSSPRNVCCRFVSLPVYVCANGCAIVQRTSKCPHD